MQTMTDRFGGRSQNVWINPQNRYSPMVVATDAYTVRTYSARMDDDAKMRKQ